MKADQPIRKLLRANALVIEYKELSTNKPIAKSVDYFASGCPPLVLFRIPLERGSEGLFLDKCPANPS